MSGYDFRASRGFGPNAMLRALGGDYLELDEVLASGAELGLEEDDGGYLMLIESGEFE